MMTGNALGWVQAKLFQHFPQQQHLTADNDIGLDNWDTKAAVPSSDAGTPFRKDAAGRC